MAKTTIEWATHVWNPFTGCDVVSPGCANCYAKKEAGLLNLREQGRIEKAEREGKPRPTVRYQNDGDPKTSGPGFGFTVHWDKLQRFNFPAGARVFVNSMSDVFHEEAPVEAIAKLWAAFASKPAVNWLVLTKRPERMQHYLTLDSFRLLVGGYLKGTLLADIEWPLPNVWLGVSIENRRFVHRADLLRGTPAAVRFISAEPLLGSLVNGCPICHGHGGRCSYCDNKPGLDIAGIDWLIVGGESGPKHRPVHKEWVEELLDLSGAPGSDVAFFFKQWGGRRAKEGGRDLDGRTWDELPATREVVA